MDIGRIKLRIKANSKIVFFRAISLLKKNQKIILGSLALTLLLNLAWLFTNRKRTYHLKGSFLEKSYTITYQAQGKGNAHPPIDNLLIEILAALNSQQAHSEIAEFNNHTCEAFQLKSPFLYTLLLKCKEVYQQTHHTFDPTVAPLITLWKKHILCRTEPTIQELQEAQQQIGLDYIVINPQRIKKLKEGLTINCDNLLYSYGMDEISNLLKKANIQQYQIRGENATIVQGYPLKKPLPISYTLPSCKTGEHPLTLHIQLTNMASVLINPIQPEAGITQPLIIDPISGKIAPNNIISVLVLAQDCTTAQAYGMALQAKGYPHAIDILTGNNTIVALIVYKNEQGTYSFYTTPSLHSEHKEETNTVYLRLDTAVKNSFLKY